MPKKKVKVLLNGKIAMAKEGCFISDIADIEKQCGGHGLCGKCKVVAKGAISEITALEKERLSPDEIKSGVRLGCVARVLGECEITKLSAEENAVIMTEGENLAIKQKPSFSGFGAAIDIGTTTLAARLYDAEGVLLSTDTRLNPQIRFGDNVLSRIEAALRSEDEELSDLIRRAINAMLLNLAKKAGISSKEIDSVTVTGNTAMLYLLTCESVEPLSFAPFKIKRFFGESRSASELCFSSLPPNAEIYIPSCISAFVGADITCAVIATELYKIEAVQMLCDIGTNGEIALWNGKSLTVTSTAAGPAFEGGGIHMGMRASDGAIDRVEIIRGTLKAHVIGGAQAKGICGSGLVDAIAVLLDLKIIDGGGFTDNDVSLLPPVILTQKDIRNVQLAKSAICAGIRTLALEKGVSPDDIEKLYIAGAFGNYLNIRNAEKIGLLPEETSSKVKAVGNAALDGASILLLNRDFREESKKVAKSAEVLELATSGIFADYYIKGMRFFDC